jgi:pimeloyl-ACP methyl ester carboxylesterase
MTRSARRASAGCSSPLRGVRSSLSVCLWCLLASAVWAQVPEKPPFAQPPGKPPIAQPKPGVVQPPAAPAVKQPTKPPATKPSTPTTKPKEDDKPPAPVPMLLDTKDGWRIHCEYYPPKEKIRSGKETVPIILVHRWGGQGSDWNFLAVGLQTLGHASMVVDLRGHGRSTTKRVLTDPTGKTETRTFEALERDDLSRIWVDLEVAKSELMKKNNAGEVNIELLTVIAAEEGCLVALDWAVRDWSWPITPAYKQGQDVKALVLLSPVESHRGMRSATYLSQPAVARQLSLMFAVGAEDSKFASSVKRMHDRIEKVRLPQWPKDDPKEMERLRDIFLIQAPTSLQGSALTDRSLPVNRAIVNFLNRRLLDRSDELRWAERRSPVGG